MMNIRDSLSVPILKYSLIGNGKPLILLHGFGLNRHIWDPICGLLQKQCQCISPDLRGQGESDVPEGIYTMKVMAEDILRLMDKLQLEKAFIAGHSMGGYVALSLAKDHPDRLDGIGLIASHARADTDEKRAGRIHDMEQVKLHGSVILAESLGPRLTKDANLVEAMKTIILSTDPKGIEMAGLGMAERQDCMEVLRNFHKPVLVVAGAEDMIVPLTASQEAAEAAPLGKLVVIPDTGHMPMLEAPNVLAEAFQHFI